MYINSLFISFGGKDKYNLCKHLGEADFCGQVRYNKCDIITLYNIRTVPVGVWRILPITCIL